MKLALALSLLFMVGCATTKPKFKETNRNKQLRNCVNSFLDRSITPKSSIGLCERIYKRIN